MTLVRTPHLNASFADMLPLVNLRNIPGLIAITLESAMANYKVPGLCENDIMEASDFIRACLKFDYTERATAKDLIRHPFAVNAFPPAVLQASPLS